MKQLGFSIYLEHGTDKEITEYIDLASIYNFKRVFMNLLSVKNEKTFFERFKKIVNYANSKDMEVIADVSRSIFNELDLTIHDLSFFKEIGLEGIRLDYGFTAIEEALMTQNKYGLKIELNMSLGTTRIDDVFSFDPSSYHLKGSHNFYPQRFTGLDFDHFIKCSKGFKKYNLYTSAFVNSENACFGPWPVKEGLCTLEMHRELPIKSQAIDLFSTGLIDEVIIANAFASEEDFKALSEINPYKLCLDVQVKSNITKLEREILEENHHRNRGDISSYLIRSSDTRAKYADKEIPANNTHDIRKGDILINNSLYTKYSGEVLIALKDIKNYGKTNVLASVVESQIHLLDRIDANGTFDLNLL